MSNYFSLMGTRALSPFDNMPLCDFWGDILERINIKAFRDFPGRNSVQISNDGMELEALSVAAVCASSHCQGFSGVGVKAFLSSLIWHLSGCN